MKKIKIENRRYLGSKARLIDFIRQVVEENCKNVQTVADIFAGTGNVANAFNQDHKVIVNDFLKVNYFSYMAWFGSEEYSTEKIEALLEEYNSCNPNGENYFSINFSDTFFSHDNCVRIGYIREDIEDRFSRNEINSREKAILITSLIYSMDKIANTVGHYDAYRMNGDLNKKLELDMLDLPSNGINKGNEIYCEDSNELVKRISSDLVYIDPPYNSRQYCDAYHLLENVAEWKKPEVYGVARKMNRSKEIKSSYCTQKAPLVFDALIQNIDAKYILVSYNNMGKKGAGRSQAKISDTDIISSLSKKGTVSIFSTDFNQFTTGKTHVENHQERLFLCTVGKKSSKECANEKVEGYVKSPLNYTGGKYKLLPQIMKEFDTDKTIFVDLFGGGFNVGANATQSHIVYLDKQDEVRRIIQLIYETPYCQLLSKIESTINEYGLSDTTTNGYEFYGCESGSGVGKYNKPHYEQLRRAYNLEKKSKKKDLLLLTLLFYGFNNQIRFNSNGEYNMPVGKRDFNSCARRNLREFSSKIKQKEIEFHSGDFESLLPLLNEDCFVYCDPPYYLGIASYNENDGWTLDDEKRLLAFLVELDRRHIPFALSNFIEHHGRKHQLLIDWTQENHFNTIYVRSKYSNSNYHIKDKSSTSVEVLITN